MLNLICKNCNNSFEVPNKQKNRKFCNHTCFVEYGVKNKKIGNKKNPDAWEFRTCVECNNLFEVRKKTPNKLCSDNCREVWNKKEENIKNRTNRTKEVIFEKYGVNSPFQIEGVREKILENNIKKYGFEIPVKNEEVRKKLSKKINDVLSEKKDEVVEKRKKTSLEKYGDKNFNNREKYNKTLNERYGGHHLKNEKIIKKQKNTFMERYGVSSVFNMKGSLEKSKKAILEKYGVNSYSKTEEYRENIIKKRLERVLKRVESHNLELVTHDIENKKGADLKCKICNNLFHHTQLYDDYLIKCPKCYPVRSNNSLNIFFEEILDNNNITYVKNSRSIIPPLELDYYIPEKNLAFELNGNYYHSELNGGKTKDYHINKTNKANEKGIKLIHIYEDEIQNKPELIKSKILSLLGCSPTKIYARNTIIKDISNQDISKFLDENHIQGNLKSKIKIGLFYNDELIFVTTFSKPRMDKKIDNTFELYRSCSKQYVNVVGGFSKCLKFFIKNYKPNRIISYADARWSGINPTTSVYEKSGFKFIGITKPNYWYVSAKSFIKRIHRFVYRKNVLVSQGKDPSKTEWEIMMEDGYDRIWDCGSLKFEMVCN